MSKRNLRDHHFIDKGDYIECRLENGRSFLFDKDDLNVIQGKCWSVDKDGYVNHWENGHNQKLHRILMENTDFPIDHINGDPRDNRRCNLRIATPKQNSRNASLRKDSSTGFKGVHYRKNRNSFVALIRVDNKLKYLGSFKDPNEAAKAYDKAAFLYFGEFARPNFREEEENEQTKNQQVLAMENSRDYQRSRRNHTGTIPLS